VTPRLKIGSSADLRSGPRDQRHALCDTMIIRYRSGTNQNDHQRQTLSGCRKTPRWSWRRTVPFETIDHQAECKGFKFHRLVGTSTWFSRQADRAAPPTACPTDGLSHSATGYVAGRSQAAMTWVGAIPGLEAHKAGPRCWVVAGAPGTRRRPRYRPIAGSSMNRSPARSARA
jgi:hypothetical protein